MRIDAENGDLHCYCPRASTGRHQFGARCAVSLNISLAVRSGPRLERLAVSLVLAHPCSLAAACEGGGGGHILPEAKSMSPCRGSLSSAEGTPRPVATASRDAREAHDWPVPGACLKWHRNARGGSPYPALFLSQYCVFYKPHPPLPSLLSKQHTLLSALPRPAPQSSITSLHFTASVLESSPLGTLVATVTAFDLDGWVREELSYSLHSDNPHSEEILTIDSRTGAIITRGKRLSFSRFVQPWYNM